MYQYASQRPAGLSQSCLPCDPPGEMDDEKKNLQWVEEGSKKKMVCERVG